MSHKHPSHSDLFPQVPIDRVVAPIRRFMHVEMTSGIFLFVAALAAIIAANSSLAEYYHHLWETPVGFSFGSFSLEMTLHHWINDGLMTLFFFVVGLELKGELTYGELRDPKAASLPILAAMGGMLFPALIYLAISAPESRHGWGIPTATDIAFVVGAMVLLGKRVPKSLRIMILTLAIADDMGAILVIAIGYSTGVQYPALLLAAGLLGLIHLAARSGVRSVGVYAFLGVSVWLAFHYSGVHATLAGVALGLLTPAKPWLGGDSLSNAANSLINFITGGPSDTNKRMAMLRAMQKASRESMSPLERLTQNLHPWVSFLIMPLFAFANAGVEIHPSAMGSSVTQAAGLGLVLGKPIGVFLFSVLAVKIGIAKLPTGVTWPVLLGGGMLAGIGFTMALFVANLAFPGQTEFLDSAKVGIMGGSLLSALLGMGLIALVSPKKTEASN